MGTIKGGEIASNKTGKTDISDNYDGSAKIYLKQIKSLVIIDISSD